MTHGLSADPYSLCSAKFFHAAEASLFSAMKYVVSYAIGRAEINEFTDVILDTRLFEHGQHQKAAHRRRDSEPIRAGYPVNIVGSLSSPRARHVFRDNRGLARDVFPNEVCQ